MNKKLYVIVGLIVATIAGLLAKSFCIQEGSTKMLSIINKSSDIVALFPKTPEELNRLVDQSIVDAQKQLDALVAVPRKERSFENTARAYDTICSNSNLSVFIRLAQIIQMVHPDKEMRDAGQKGFITIQQFYVDNLENNVELYNAFKDYVEGNASQEKLSAEQQYFLDKVMRGFKRQGLHLPQKQMDEVKSLKKKLAELGMQFDKNIADDDRTVIVTRQELQGLDDDFINALKKTDDGKFILGMDYPTSCNVMENCDVVSTRKRFFDAFMNCAYPANKTILQEIIKLRDELAHKLGFSSYAQLDMDDQMVGSPENAEKFINELLEKVQLKEAKEFDQFTAALPASVTLSPDGKMYPWDMGYTKAQYKKKHYAVDENKIAEYFPMEKTIEGLLAIYEQFLGLEFKQTPVPGLWDDEVTLVEVFDAQTKNLLGYLLFDLYPRPNKYNHACHAGIVPAVKNADGSETCRVALIVANFPKSTATKPSLLQRNDVNTFFHEFGHAMHGMLARPTLASFAGTGVKTDFVEVPSQMFEEWLGDKEILKQVSCHYKTGESLPDDLIDTLINIKNLSSGGFVQRQLFLSLFSLNCFKDGCDKDIDQLAQDLFKQTCVTSACDDNYHFYARFGHLTGYSSKYYAYMWSKVFAIDLFADIKKEGLLNQKTGKRLAAQVLSKGGSEDPRELLKTFLGREPNQENFLKDLGLSI